MIRRHTKAILSLFVISLFIGTSIVPAFSSDLSIINDVRESIPSDTNDYSDESKENNGRNLFQRIGQKVKQSTNAFFPSRFQEYREQLQDNYLPQTLHRSQPVTIEGVIGEWDMVVPDDYSTIQQAVDNAGPENGYRIFVRSGTFKENIVIDTDGVILHGEKKEYTIIDGGNNGHVVRLDSSYNNISGFTIQNSRTDHAGLYFDVSSGNQIHNNKLNSNEGSGLFLSRSHANNITDNNIHDNAKQGIHIDASSLANTISNNMVKNNQESGVLISNASRSNLIAGNKVESNNVGVKITGVSENNLLHHNQFIANDQNAFDDYDNYWDDQVGEGNYWGDYTGTDADGDGIGDTPYFISGGDNKDRYPLMNTPGMNYFSFQIKEMQSDNSSNFSNTDFSFSGNTIIVPDDHPTIQSAVDHAVDGDRIEVRPGTYYENILVDKSISIVGSDPENTIVDGQQVNHVFKIISNNAMVSGFIIQNTTMGYAGLKITGDNVKITGNKIQDCGDGVNIGGANIHINNNTISSCNFGIYFEESINVIIKNNLMINNNDGIVTWSSENIHIINSTINNGFFTGFLQLWSKKCNIYDNTINDISSGIVIFSTSDIIIEKNIIEECYFGIVLYKSNNNKIIDTTVNNTYRVAILIFFNSNNNIIEKNKINENINDAIFIFLSNDIHIYNNTIKNNYRGIFTYYTNNLIVRNNRISECDIGGFLNYITAPSNNIIIKDNNISYNGVGISLSSSSNCRIDNNTIYSNYVSGILLVFDNKLYISHNIISNNSIGIQTMLCPSLDVVKNSFSKNQIGIFLLLNPICKIYRNNFIENTIHATTMTGVFDNQLLKISKHVLYRWFNNYWDNWVISIPKPVIECAILNIFFVKYLDVNFFMLEVLFLISDIIINPIKELIENGFSSALYELIDGLGVKIQFDWHPASEPYDIGG